MGGASWSGGAAARSCSGSDSSARWDPRPRGFSGGRGRIGLCSSAPRLTNPLRDEMFGCRSSAPAVRGTSSLTYTRTRARRRTHSPRTSFGSVGPIAPRFSRGEGWVRFAFERIRPNQRSPRSCPCSEAASSENRRNPRSQPARPKVDQWMLRRVPLRHGATPEVSESRRASPTWSISADPALRFALAGVRAARQVRRRHPARRGACGPRRPPGSPCPLTQRAAKRELPRTPAPGSPLSRRPGWRLR